MPRPRTWTDEELTHAIAGARSWKEVCGRLGVPVGGKTVQSLRRRADDLEIDYDQLYGGGLRQRRERTITDDALKQLVPLCNSWNDLARRLGYSTKLRGEQERRIVQRIDELGLMTTHFRSRGYNGLPQIPASQSVFVGRPDPKRLRFAAIGTAIAWFTQRGYIVSTPVEPAVYDLLVDAGKDGIYRIQVKTSASPRRAVGFSRNGYDNRRPGSQSAGYARRSPYEPGDLDFFFVVLADGSLYLIPYEVIGRRKNAILSSRYEGFKIS